MFNHTRGRALAGATMALFTLAGSLVTGVVSGGSVAAAASLPHRLATAGAGSTPGVIPRLHGRYITPAGAVSVNAVSCAPSGYCLIGGVEKDSKGEFGFVAQVNNGVVVGKILRVRGMASVQDIACPQNLWCLAYGFGSATHGITPDRISAISGGVPGASATIGTGLRMHAVGCESAINCFVVGVDGTSGYIVPVIKGVPDLGGAKKETGPLFSTIACPESLSTCVVLGANKLKPRVSYVVRIIDASISGASKTTGIEVLTGVWCSAYYTCLAAGFDTNAKTGAVETLSHTSGTHEKTTMTPFLFDTICATTANCVSVAQAHVGTWGYVPETNGVPGTFVAIMTPTSKQSASAVACQGTAHCYEVGYTTTSSGSVGVLYRFVL